MDQGTTLLAGLFMAGLVGGAGHCITMCGPFVVSQVTARLKAVPASHMTEMSRLSGAALIPYHLGRTTTYAFLGMAGGFLSGGVATVSGLSGFSTVFLVLAAVFFFGYAAASFGFRIPGFGTSGEAGPLARTLDRVARPLFNHPLGWRGYVLGVALGFIPCGMLYGALAAAASTGDPFAGLLAMTAFALGTLPSLIVVGLAGHMVAGRWKGGAMRIAPVLLSFNGAFLLFLAYRSVL
jgi:uncharacterized protein